MSVEEQAGQFPTEECVYTDPICRRTILGPGERWRGCWAGCPRGLPRPLRMADFRRVEARLNRETFSEMSVEEQAGQFPTKSAFTQTRFADGLFTFPVTGGVGIGSALQAVCGTHSLCSPQS